MVVTASTLTILTTSNMEVVLSILLEPFYLSPPRRAFNRTATPIKPASGLILTLAFLLLPHSVTSTAQDQQDRGVPTHTIRAQVLQSHFEFCSPRMP
jgi:hypothetical protein